MSIHSGYAGKEDGPDMRDSLTIPFVVYQSSQEKSLSLVSTRIFSQFPAIKPGRCPFLSLRGSEGI